MKIKGINSQLVLSPQDMVTLVNIGLADSDGAYGRFKASRVVYDGASHRFEISLKSDEEEKCPKSM